MTTQEKEVARKIEKEARHNAAILSRQQWADKSSKKGRKRIALSLLERQLEDGYKPVKGPKPFKIDENGSIVMEERKDKSFHPVLLNVVPLSPVDETRICKDIFSLKNKLKISSI